MEELDIDIHDVLIVEAVPCGLAVVARLCSAIDIYEIFHIIIY